jgi:hypothetical protein
MKTWKRLGETIREIGILVFVFAPLDVMLQASAPYIGRWFVRWSDTWQPAGPEIHFHWFELVFMGLGMALIALGLWIEARADRREEQC